MKTSRGPQAIVLAALWFATLTRGSAQSLTPPYPPPGRMIDLGGFRVHLYCVGKGKPTVIVVGGGFSFDWGLVQPEVAKFSEICSYDVSGTAWSDAGPIENCADRVSEVHALLNTAQLHGPFVFVGLSVGALVARLYAARYPNNVAGMVMVDHAFIDVGSGPPKSGSDALVSLGLDSPPVLIHKESIALTVEDTSDFAKLPEATQRLHRWAESLKPKLPTVETAEECLSLLKPMAPVHPELGAMPLVVVSTGNDLPNYHALQSELLALSSRSHQLIAERSFHSVEIDQPDIVIRAIRQVIEMARQTKDTNEPGKLR